MKMEEGLSEYFSFSLPFIVPPTAPFSHLSSGTGTKGPFVTAVPQDSQPYPVPRIKVKAMYCGTPI